MPFVQKVVDGFAYGIGLTLAWFITGALVRFIAGAVP